MNGVHGDYMKRDAQRLKEKFTRNNFVFLENGELETANNGAVHFSTYSIEDSILILQSMKTAYFFWVNIAHDQDGHTLDHTFNVVHKCKANKGNRILVCEYKNPSFGGTCILHIATQSEIQENKQKQ